MVAALTACGLAAADIRRRRRRERTDRALHELRRPLQALLLTSRPAEEGERLTAIDLALAALHDLELVLDGGQPEIGHSRPLATPTWSRLLRDTTDRWQQAAWLRGGKISYRCLIDGAGTLPEGVAIAVSRALDNLVLNALTHGGARVEITVVAQPPGIEVRVADSGSPPPIPPAPRQIRRKGLKVVAEIADRLGGRFDLDRNKNGCLATLSLPPLGQMR